MKKRENSKRSLFDDKRFSVVFALLLAVLAWVIVAGFINPGEEFPISNVPINYTRGEADYKNQDLMIVNEGTRDVSVTIRNEGSAMNLSPADIMIYLDYSVVTGPGEYDVPLRGQNIASGNYSINEIRPGTVRLHFEKMMTRSFAVTADAEGVEAAPGYFRDVPVASPAQVEVTGPESDVERIAQVVAAVVEEEVLESTRYYPLVQLQLLDEAGNAITNELITTSPGDVEVGVPILEVRSVPVVVEFIGGPDGLDTNWLESLMTLSVDEIRIAGEPEALNRMTQYNAGTIDLSTFAVEEDGSVSSSFPPFTVALPEGIKNHDQIKQINVTFDTSGLVSRTYQNIPNISVKNQPAGMRIEPVDAVVPNVTLIGPPEVLDTLLPENIQVQIDAYGTVAAQGGQQTFAGRVQVPGRTQVFPAGNPQVICDVIVED